MESEVFSSPKFKEAAKNFVLCRVNGEVRTDLFSKYGCTGFPTIIFFNSKGDEIDRIPGYMPLDAFVDEVKKAASKL